MQILFAVLLYITVIGALNWGCHVYGCNMVEKFANMVSNDSKNVENGIYYVVAVSGLILGLMYARHLYYRNDEEKDNKY